MPNRLIVERTTRIDCPVEEVWQWHTRPGAFERLTPPWEKVRLLERTGGIENADRSAHARGCLVATDRTDCSCRSNPGRGS